MKLLFYITIALQIYSIHSRLAVRKKTRSVKSSRKKISLSCSCGGFLGEVFVIPVYRCLITDKTTGEQSYEACAKKYRKRHPCDDYKDCQSCKDHVPHCITCPDGKRGKFCTKDSVTSKGNKKRKQHKRDTDLLLNAQVPEGNMQQGLLPLEALDNMQRVQNSVQAENAMQEEHNLQSIGSMQESDHLPYKAPQDNILQRQGQDLQDNAPAHNQEKEVTSPAIPGSKNEAIEKIPPDRGAKKSKLHDLDSTQTRTKLRNNDDQSRIQHDGEEEDLNSSDKINKYTDGNISHKFDSDKRKHRNYYKSGPNVYFNNENNNRTIGTFPNQTGLILSGNNPNYNKKNAVAPVSGIIPIQPIGTFPNQTGLMLSGSNPNYNKKNVVASVSGIIPIQPIGTFPNQTGLMPSGSNPNYNKKNVVAPVSGIIPIQPIGTFPNQTGLMLSGSNPNYNKKNVVASVSGIIPIQPSQLYSNDGIQQQPQFQDFPDLLDNLSEDKKSKSTKKKDSKSTKSSDKSTTVDIGHPENNEENPCACKN